MICTRYRARTAIALALALACGCPAVASAPAQPQREPALKGLLQAIIGSAECYTDKYDAEVWHKSMEPRLRRFVASYVERIEILDDVYCEAKRDPHTLLPPGLVLAMIEVESRFNRYAVSSVGAVGLMQVMPYWPRQLGVQNELVRIGPNIRLGCEILRFYLRAAKHDWIRALERYNGSDGHVRYPELVMERWQRVWRF